MRNRLVSSLSALRRSFVEAHWCWQYHSLIFLHLAEGFLSMYVRRVQPLAFVSTNATVLFQQRAKKNRSKTNIELPRCVIAHIGIHWPSCSLCSHERKRKRLSLSLSFQMLHNWRQRERQSRENIRSSRKVPRRLRCWFCSSTSLRVCHHFVFSLRRCNRLPFSLSNAISQQNCLSSTLAQSLGHLHGRSRSLSHCFSVPHGIG